MRARRARSSRARDFDRSRRRLVETGDEPEQRALAAAAAADDGQELSGGDMKIDAAQHRLRAERFSDAAQRERRAGGASLLRCIAVKGE